MSVDHTSRVGAALVGLLASLPACEPYSTNDATLYNATAFAINVRLSSAAVSCEAASSTLQASDFQLRSCVELPPDGLEGLRGAPDRSRCAAAAVESDGLPTTLLRWRRYPDPTETSYGHPDPNTVYLERVGDRLFLADAPRVTAELAPWTLPDLPCPDGSGM